MTASEQRMKPLNLNRLMKREFRAKPLTSRLPKRVTKTDKLPPLTFVLDSNHPPVSLNVTRPHVRPIAD
jgi:hypothetical protein